MLFTSKGAAGVTGGAFFGNYYLMDYELMGGDGRQAIIDESKSAA